MTPFQIKRAAARGFQPRSPKPSFLKDKIVPTLITFAVLTVGGALITSIFQFSQWRQTTALARSQETLKRADAAAHDTMKLLSERYYYTYVAIETWANDPEGRYKEWMVKYRNAVEHWNLNYDSLLARLDADLDDALDTRRDISFPAVRQVSCQHALIGQPTAYAVKREVVFDGKVQDIFSSRFMLAAIRYCFQNITRKFNEIRQNPDHERMTPAEKAVLTKSLLEDLGHLLANQNLLRRNLLTKVGYIRENDTVPNWITYIGLVKLGRLFDATFKRPPKPVPADPTTYKPAEPSLRSADGAS